MRANLFWLNDEQREKIEPLIPMNRPGPKPQNNRRILSGIIHVLKTGCRWQRSAGSTARVRRCIIASIAGASAESGNRSSRGRLTNSPEQVAVDSTHVKAHRCASGGKGGRRSRRSASPGVGRNSKVHALVDEFCRPWVIIITAGNVADCTVGPQCESLMDGIAPRGRDQAGDPRPGKS